MISNRLDFMSSIIDNYPAFVNNYAQLMTIYDFCNLYDIKTIDSLDISPGSIEFSAEYKRREKSIPTTYSSSYDSNYAIDANINNKVINVKMSMTY